MSGFMTEISNSELCSVKSYPSYVANLNLANDKLWQQPKDSFCLEDNTWYYNIPLGKKTLTNFMSKISQLCSLTT